MKIVKCARCGKYIHEAPRCCFCGNTSGFEEIFEDAVHENAARDYARLQTLVEDKRFDEAIKLSYDILEWAPNVSGVFRLRLLAKNRCTDDSALIAKGFSPEEDPDFLNALRFSKKEERAAYEAVRKAVFDLRTNLKEELKRHEHHSKANTDILRIRDQIGGELERRRNNLFSAWSELEKAEQSLYAVSADCRLIVKEHQEALAEAAKEATDIKAEASGMRECTATQLHAFHVRLGKALDRSNGAREAMSSMQKEHPWIRSFSELASQRDRQARALRSEIDGLKAYCKTVQQTTDEINRIEKRHKTALDAAERFDFQDAAALLGEDAFNKVLLRAGVGTGVLTGAAAGSAQSERSEKKSEDYYSVWGLTED